MSEANNVHCSLLMFNVFSLCNFKILIFKKKKKKQKPIDERKGEVRPMYDELLQLCPTLCDSMNCSPPGSFVHGILQVRILEWVAMPFSRGSSQPRDRTLVSQVSCIGRQVLYNQCHLGCPRPIPSAYYKATVSKNVQKQADQCSIKKN